MVFPINIHVFGTEMSTHLVCEFAGIFIGIRYYMFLRKRSVDLINDLHRLYIFAAVCIGSLIGSRLVGVLENPYEFIASDDKFKYIFSNKTIVGGLVFGLFAVEAMKKYIGIRASSGDLMVYPIIISLIIGRIGCFCEGLSDGTIGAATSGWYGVDFGDGIRRHPLPLYEVVFLTGLFGFIHWIQFKYTLSDGMKFKIFLIGYLLFRLGVEFLKGDQFTVLGLSTIQLTAVLGICYYLMVYLIHKPKLNKYNSEEV
jgi:phosphatidylglycerol:prolipoprotein diacylglycerol transferase